MSAVKHPIRALVVTGSRADRNGLEVVHEALLEAGHDSVLYDDADEEAFPFPAQDYAEGCDVAVVGGDRSEILHAAFWLADMRIPIAHIAGGDVTEGSADDRYRDAITALACIHFVTNEDARFRLEGDPLSLNHTVPRVHPGDSVYLTGSPAIDRIKQTPVLDRYTTFAQFGAGSDGKWLLVCVHPNTVGSDPLADWEVVCKALSRLDLPCVILGANADDGGSKINGLWRDWVAVHRENIFRENVSPQLYYSLMAHCDVMVGNSSAMLYEAPCFGLPCVLVGDRQKGRPLPINVTRATSPVDHHIEWSIADGRIDCENPYGDGQSAPRIVKALEDNAWRWSTDDSTVKARETVAE